MKNKLYCLTKPIRYTNLDGSNPIYNWHGKFIKKPFNLFERGMLATPIFSSIWPGLPIKEGGFRELYWYEHIEYFLKISWARVRVFFHYQRMALLVMIGK